MVQIFVVTLDHNDIVEEIFLNPREIPRFAAVFWSAANLCYVWPLLCGLTVYFVAS